MAIIYNHGLWHKKAKESHILIPIWCLMSELRRDTSQLSL